MLMPEKPISNLLHQSTYSISITRRFTAEPPSGRNRSRRIKFHPFLADVSYILLIWGFAYRIFEVSYWKVRLRLIPKSKQQRTVCADLLWRRGTARSSRVLLLTLCFADRLKTKGLVNQNLTPFTSSAAQLRWELKFTTYRLETLPRNSDM